MFLKLSANNSKAQIVSSIDVVFSILNKLVCKFKLILFDLAVFSVLSDLSYEAMRQCLQFMSQMITVTFGENAEE